MGYRRPRIQVFVIVPLSCVYRLRFRRVPGMRPPGLDNIQRLDIFWFSFFCAPHRFPMTTMTDVNCMSWNIVLLFDDFDRRS